MNLLNIIESSSDKLLAQEIIDSFRELERNYNLKSWKTSELDAGHFVEAVRRFLELKLYGSYTPLGENLSSFNEQALNKYLQAKGDESYRIHIPRALWLIYGIRNKRGVGHLSVIKANQIDASLILQTSKWIMADLIRINSNIPIQDTELLVDEIVERNIEGVWKIGEVKRLLIDGLTLKQQILVLLYNFESLTDQGLFSILENGNFSYLKTSLKQLHKMRLLEYQPNGECYLSPKGSLEAEKILIKDR